MWVSILVCQCVSVCMLEWVCVCMCVYVCACVCVARCVCMWERVYGQAAGNVPLNPLIYVQRSSKRKHSFFSRHDHWKYLLKTFLPLGPSCDIACRHGSHRDALNTRPWLQARNAKTRRGRHKLHNHSSMSCKAHLRQENLDSVISLETGNV